MQNMVELYFFGIPGVCIISHGSSKAPSIFSAIRNAKEAIDNKVIENMTNSIEETHHKTLSSSSTTQD